jgi:hypothetical protein
LPCVVIVHAILLFSEYSDSHFRVAEPAADVPAGSKSLPL